MFQLFAAVGMAHAGLALGEPDLALSFADTALGIADRYGYAAYRVHALRARGTVSDPTAGRHAEGLSDLNAALDAATVLGLAAAAAHTHAALAIAGEDHAEAARDAYARLGLTASRARLDSALASGRAVYL